MRDTPLGDVAHAHSLARAREWVRRRRTARSTPFATRTAPARRSASRTCSSCAPSSSRSASPCSTPAIRPCAARRALFSRRARARARDRCGAHRARAGAARPRLRSAGRARARAVHGVPLRASARARAFRSPRRCASTGMRSSRRTSCCGRWPSGRSCPRSPTWAGRARSRTSRRPPQSRSVLGAAVPLVVPRWTGMIIEPHVQRLLARYRSYARRSARSARGGVEARARAAPACGARRARELRDGGGRAQRRAARGARDRCAAAARPRRGARRRAAQHRAPH